MTQENIEQVEKWFEEIYDSYTFNQRNEGFEQLTDKPAESEQVCAVMFLYEKLKPENKAQRWFFHGEHDKLYIGSDFDIFQDFTKEDVRRAILYGLDLSDVDGGFQINASM